MLNNRLELLQLLLHNYLVQLCVQLFFYYFIINLKKIIFSIYIFDFIFQIFFGTYLINLYFYLILIYNFLNYCLKLIIFGFIIKNNFIIFLNISFEIPKLYRIFIYIKARVSLSLRILFSKKIFYILNLINLF
jgi:hypothetical protein